MIPCLDVLGLADNDWKVKTTARAVPSGIGGGTFADGPFGNGIKASEIWLSSRENDALKTPLWRYQFWRSHALTSMKDLERALPLIQQQALTFRDTEFFVSHSCEYQTNSLKEVKRRVALIRKLAPRCTPINNPWNSPSTNDCPKEVHSGTAKPGEFISFDGGYISEQKKGLALYDIDAQAWFEKQKNAYAAFAWAPRFNLAESKQSLPAGIRTAAPSPQFCRGMAYLSYRPTPAPLPVFKYRMLKKPEVFKAWAEDMPGENSRDNRGMIFARENLGSAKVVTFQGTVIYEFPKYKDPEPHDLERYYSGLNPAKLYSWEIAERARQVSGHPWFWFQLGNNFYGPFTWFRAPWFQA